MSDVDREALMREMAKAWREASAGALWSDALNAVEPAIRAAEREACAQVAETKFSQLSNMYRAAGREIAAAIRAREGKS